METKELTAAACSSIYHMDQECSPKMHRTQGSFPQDTFVKSTKGHCRAEDQLENKTQKPIKHGSDCPRTSSITQERLDVECRHLLPPSQVCQENRNSASTHRQLTQPNRCVY
uniref:Uncharacterized protein n=1 Tax=Mus musculus TaxID=10090 RepID=Q3US27_MOUSE|nr:unnamed protein product [Mus musculus]